MFDDSEISCEILPDGWKNIKTRIDFFEVVDITNAAFSLSCRNDEATFPADIIIEIERGRRWEQDRRLSWDYHLNWQSILDQNYSYLLFFSIFSFHFCPFLSPILLPFVISFFHSFRYVYVHHVVTVHPVTLDIAQFKRITTKFLKLKNKFFPFQGIADSEVIKLCFRSIFASSLFSWQTNCMKYAKKTVATHSWMFAFVASSWKHHGIFPRW